MSEDVKMLVANMIERDVEKRFTAQQCLEDIWFKELRYKESEISTQQIIGNL